MKPYCCALTIDSEIPAETRLGRGLSEKKKPVQSDVTTLAKCEI